MADSLAGQSQRLLDDVIALRPEFARVWSEEGYLWADDSGRFTMCGVFASFSHYIAEVLTVLGSPRQEDVFAFVEECMGGEEEISTAATTCFLENLMYRAPDDIKPESFIPLLGPTSREYCRVLDEYHGTRTEGLWEPPAESEGEQ